MKNSEEFAPDWLTKQTEERPHLMFWLIFLVTFFLGILLFLSLWESSGKVLVQSLAAADAGSFLQGVWGTAGSLAAAFVAIVLARQALALTRKQDDDQTKQDKRNEQLQREQNRILQQNTPEYDMAYQAAMSSTKLDSLQILIGSMERKKFRGITPTMFDVLEVRQPVGDEIEVKREIKSELLGSRYISFAAEVAEKIYGMNGRLEIEALASELIVSSRPTMDKLLICRLNKTIHNMVDFFMQDIRKILKTEGNQPDLDFDPEIFRFTEYQRLKIYGQNAENRKNQSISKSAYYFVNVLFAQMRRVEYSYVETNLLETLIAEKIGTRDMFFFNHNSLPKDEKYFNQGFCVITPFDFQRATLLVDLKFPDRNNTSCRRRIVEGSRGKPDRAIMEAINSNADDNPIVFLDQIEGMQDSIQKRKWLTFSEHLVFWEGMQQISKLLGKEDDQLLDWALKEFVDFVRRDVPLCLSENETEKAYLEKLLPRYWSISGVQIDTVLGRMSNYEVICRQALLQLEKNESEQNSGSDTFYFFVTGILDILNVNTGNSFKNGSINIGEFRNFLNQFQDATCIVKELAKRPYFERPFFGWIIPDFDMTCALKTAKDQSIGFVGVHYLHDFIFKPNMLFQWLTSPNLTLDPAIRKSVAIAAV